MDNNFNDKLPIYIQIINGIKKDIISGNIKPGDKLPSVRELSSQLKVNPNTISRVYQEIERDGITFTQRGTGTFIREDTAMIASIKKEMAGELIADFLQGMKNMGYTKEEIIKVISDKWNDIEKN